MSNTKQRTLTETQIFYKCLQRINTFDQIQSPNQTGIDSRFIVCPGYLQSE